MSPSQTTGIKKTSMTTSTIEVEKGNLFNFAVVSGPKKPTTATAINAITAMPKIRRGLQTFHYSNTGRLAS
ncbi:hypothetical protein [Lacticaseibacillus sp. N501-2]|uniref:hypothetical protein n=1 Tax=Lacticaseibacillus salsurae TaxID=3367729 RepID=UPI0038B3DCC5